MSASNRTVLFTGFPGFIGSRLLVRLLADDPSMRVVALVEPKMAERAREVAKAISDRIAIEPGDITDRRLGLSEARYNELAESVSLVMHLAAIYDLAVPQAVADNVNVNGTRHILDFCHACKHLERLHYVSTAYVAGTRTGRVMEADLDVGQTFKNHYESTKFGAEVLVRQNMKAIPTTIYRPGIVVGDSRTGETQKFDGPYYLLRFVALMAQYHLPAPQIASEESTFNAVPVDFIVDAFAAGVRDPKMIGETLHLVDPNPVPAAELLRLLAKSYAGKGLHYRIPNALVQNLLKSDLMRRLMANTPQETVIYLNHPVTFDTSRATALLAAHDVRCPRFYDYVDNMVSFFRAHEKDPAFASKK
jgi:thioester reductase-like protein